MMKYLMLLRNAKSLVFLVHPLFRPRWVDAIDRGLMRLYEAGRPTRDHRSSDFLQVNKP
jgi:hypothetical protein